MSSAAVEEFIQQRFSALAQGNFPQVYASYHPEAPFLQQFPGEEDYLIFATESLTQIKVLTTYIGEQRATARGIEMICGLEYSLDGEPQRLFELALVMETARGWRYHSAQKLTADDYFGPFAALDFKVFDEQAVKICF